MDKLLVQMYNSIFSPNNLSNRIKTSFLIPLIIILIYTLSPLVLEGFNYVYFIILFTYMSNGLRYIFSKNDISYILISSSMPLVFGIISTPLFLISGAWSLILKSYHEIRNENYYSFLLGLTFDILIIWWYL